MKNLPELVRSFNECDDAREYQISSPLAFVQAVENESAGNVRVLQGELTEGKHSRVHKTIFSCRADLKLLNNEVEALLVNTLEPVLAIGRGLGHDYPARDCGGYLEADVLQRRARQHRRLQQRRHQP